MKYLLFFLTIFVFLSCDDLDENSITCKENSDCPKDFTCYNNSCQKCPENSLQNLDNVCHCDQEHYYDIDKNSCINPCSEADCNEDQTCYSNKDSYYCACERGKIFILGECIDDKKCENIDCGEGNYCYNGICYPEDECSPKNLKGVCPGSRIENENFKCLNGTCVIDQDMESEPKDYMESCTIPNHEDINWKEPCKEGFTCISTNPFAKRNYNDQDSDRGKCLALCDLRFNNCPQDEVCVPYGIETDDNFSTKYKSIGICVPGDCETDSDCGDSDLICNEVVPDVKYCTENGNRDVGGPCFSDKNCSRDLVCVDNTCTKICDPLKDVSRCEEMECLPYEMVEPGSNPRMGICYNLCQSEVNQDGNSYLFSEDPQCNGVCLDQMNEAILVGSKSDPYNTSLCLESNCIDDSDCSQDGTFICSLEYPGNKLCKVAGELTTNSPCDPEPTLIDQYRAESVCEKDNFCSENDNGDGGTCVQVCEIENPSCDDNYTCLDLYEIYKHIPATKNLLAPQLLGICIPYCSDEIPNGYCPGGKVCQNGECIGEE